ncbi:MAG TPA: sigma-54-dependent Fis family transcriptional regulator [Terracidiphilus sp.]|jgi:formate hydrogenlyase transcriptional activator
MPRIAATVRSRAPHPSAPDSSFAKQLRDTLNAVPGYAWYSTSSGALTFANKWAADYGGLPADHPLRLGIETGASWDWHIAFLHPDDHDETRNVWSKCLETGCTSEVTFRVMSGKGEYRWFISRAEPLRAPDGTILFWIGINLDIEERVRAEQALRKSEAELRQILDLTPQFIAVCGPNRERIYANRVALDYLGVTLSEWFDNRPSPDGHPEIHQDDAARLLASWEQASVNDVPFEVEARIRGRDGHYRWFLARFSPVQDEKGHKLRWYCACTDIEDRKRQEDRLLQENAALRAEISQSSMTDEIIGSSESLRKVLAEVAKVARTDSTVLILGETGSGKELIARAVHRRSGRAACPFVGVNCAAIPTSLIASELFGHEKGAFTGATQRRLGRFEAANGGTIFLDEVGDLPADIQIALLRVLQEREIERVGGDKPVHIDVRVLAATHRDLEKLVNEGNFRQDLYYRLNVVPVTVPPLRERSADIPMLVEYFIARFSKRVGKRFNAIDRQTMELLRAYSWPGNVRELQNVIERAVTLSESEDFRVDAAWLTRRPRALFDGKAALEGELLTHEKSAIESALGHCQGRVSGPGGAASRLGMRASTLESRIRRFGIDKYKFKSK